MHIYSDNEIREILNITKKYEAKTYLYPTMQLLSNFFLIFILAYSIYLLSNKNSYTSFSVIIFLATFLILMFLRNFMVFHDLCHANYFPSKEREQKSWGINRWIAIVLDIFYLYPGIKWINIHSEHHENHGDIDKHDGARSLLNSKEYCELCDKNNCMYQNIYDILRNKYVFFTLVPLWTFILSHIYSFDIIFILKFIIIFYLITRFFNSRTAIIIFICFYVSAIFGTMLFHLQHSINEPYWEKINNDNDKMNASLHDSSVLKIHYLLKPFSNGIEYHNVHHLNPGVPSYNIQECYEYLKDKNILKNNEVDLKVMMEALNHTLFDIDNNKYIDHLQENYKCKYN